MRKRDKKIESLRAIIREYEIALAACDALDSLLRSQSNFLTRRQFQMQDYRRYRKQLAETYVIRLFIQFEDMFREYWATIKNNVPPVSHLLESLANRRRCSNDVYRAVDDLREYRNGLIHGASIFVRKFDISEAAQAASRFMSQLPPDW